MARKKPEDFDESAHELAKSLVAYERIMATVSPASAGGIQTAEEVEQMRIDGDIIERAAARARELQAQQDQ